jgi:hypothetical protein
MENISRGLTFGDFVSIRTDVRTSQLQDYRVQEYRLPFPSSFKCNVLRESLSVDSQNMDFRMNLMPSFSDPLKIVFA